MTPTTWRWLGCKKVDGRNVFGKELAERDLAACHEIHQLQVEKYGKEVVGDEPNLLKFPVWLSLVAERDGKVVDYWYFEMELEGCQGGTDAQAAASLRRHAPELATKVRNKGFRFVRTVVPRTATWWRILYGIVAFLNKCGVSFPRRFTPRVVEVPIGKELTRAGFRRQDKYQHFLLDLR